MVTPVSAHQPCSPLFPPFLLRSRYFQTAAALVDHEKTKPHKRRWVKAAANSAAAFAHTPHRSTHTSSNWTHTPLTDSCCPCWAPRLTCAG